MLKQVGIFFILLFLFSSIGSNVFADTDPKTQVLINSDIVLSGGLDSLSDEAASYYHFMCGILASQEFQWDNAIQYFNTSLASATEDASYVSLKLALSYIRQREYDKAKHILEGISDSDQYDVALLLGIIYHLENKLDKAIQFYRKAAELDPTAENAYLALGDLYILKKEHDQAIVWLEKAKEVVADNFGVYFKLGMLYASQKKYNLAIDSFTFGLKLAPHFKNLNLGLAIAYDLSGKEAKAKEIYGKVLQDNPLETYQLIGVMYQSLKEWEKAETIYRLLLTKYPDKKMYYFLLGYVLIRQSKLDMAVTIFEKIRQLKDASLEDYYVLGMIYVGQKKFMKAAEIYTDALRFNKDQDQLYYKLAEIYDIQGKRDQVVDALKNAIRMNSKNAEALNYLGYLFIESGEHLEEAIDYVKRALKIMPNNAAYMDSLGWGYFKLGKFKEAVVTLERAVNLLPEDVIILEHLGDAYLKGGVLDKVLDVWEKALKSDVENELLRQKIEKFKMKNNKDNLLQ